MKRKKLKKTDTDPVKQIKKSKNRGKSVRAGAVAATSASKKPRSSKDIKGSKAPKALNPTKNVRSSEAKRKRLSKKR